MQANIMFLDCPAYMDDDGAARCGLPAAVEYWGTVESSSGPLESAKIRCPRGHGFNGPVEFLTVTSGGQPVCSNLVHKPANRAEESASRLSKAAPSLNSKPWQIISTFSAAN
jgi:hypothetical protein